MLEADEYKIMHDWGSEEGAQYPSLMVFVSPTMMANYQKYGDVVSSPLYLPSSRTLVWKYGGSELESSAFTIRI